MRRSKWVTLGLPILLLAAVLGVVGYFILFPGWGYFHSDCADTILWAQAAYDAGALLNPDFEYACLLPFGAQLLMLPFIGLFGLSTTTQAIGMILFVLLLAGAAFWLARTMGWSVGWCAAAVAVPLLVVCGSEKLREIFFLHAIYYTLGCLFLLVGLALVNRLWRAVETPGGTPVIWLELTGAWCLLCALNGLPSLVLFSLPLLGAVVLERFFDSRTPLFSGNNRQILLLVALGLVTTLLGLAMGDLIANGIVAGYEDAYSTFSGSGNWVDNLLGLFPAWIQLLGGDVKDGTAFLSADGILGLIRVAFALVLGILPVVMLFFYKRFDRGLRLLLLAHWVQTALVVFAFVFGRLSAANWRLSPVVFTAALLAVGFCRYLFRERAGIRWGGLVLAAVVAFCGINAVTVLRMPHDYKQDTGMNGLADFLVENDLTYGYADFWSASVLTVLSDSQVKVRNIKVEDGEIKKYTYQQEKSWYRQQETDEHYFLLLSKAEYQELEKAESPVLAQATGQLTYEGYVILPMENSLF